MQKTGSVLVTRKQIIVMKLRCQFVPLPCLLQLKSKADQKCKSKRGIVHACLYTTLQGKDCCNLIKSLSHWIINLQLVDSRSRHMIYQSCCMFFPPYILPILLFLSLMWIFAKVCARKIDVVGLLRIPSHVVHSQLPL